MGSRKQTPSRNAARTPQGRAAVRKGNGTAKAGGTAKAAGKAPPPAKAKASPKTAAVKAKPARVAKMAPAPTKAAASKPKAELIRVPPKRPGPAKTAAGPPKKAAKPHPAITMPQDAAKAPAISSRQSPPMKRHGQHINGSSPAHEALSAAAPPARRPRKLASQSLPNGYRPSDAEPFMNDHQRLYFRNKLLQWKDDIIKQNRETLQILHDDTLQHADLADRATSEAERALELRARDRQRKLINKIDAALARIEDGSYGYCEETGEPISLKRLDARPIATLSLEAQERHERRERVYRED